MKKLVSLRILLLLTLVFSVTATCQTSISSGKPPCRENTLPGKNLKYAPVNILDINNVEVTITALGATFYNPWIEKAGFEFLKGSGKNTMFYNALWIGGRGPDEMLYFACDRYGAYSQYYPADYIPGPASSELSLSFEGPWNRVWKINKEEIDYHKVHFKDNGYSIPDDIRDWPAHSDVAKGETYHLAPFADMNSNNLYEPQLGDYPAIRGDQAIYFIYNDNTYHISSHSQPMKVEIHGMAYAFNCPMEEAFSNSVFVHYDIFNRSETDYHDTYLGLFSEFNIGTANDDCMIFDVDRNTLFAYNGDERDGDSLTVYGNSPPVQSCVLLSGPLMDPDNMDNPLQDEQGTLLCSYGLTGKNFNDAIIDNERYGFTTFFVNTLPWWFPAPIPNYYTYLTYFDEQVGFTIRYGGDGTSTSAPPCRFMFPGLSDSHYWGTDCIMPNTEVNWTFETAGIPPKDVWSLAGLGPFTFKAGGHQDIDLVYTATDNYTGDVSQTLNMARHNTDVAKVYFDLNETPCGGTILSQPNTAQGRKLYVFPNPAGEVLRIGSDRSLASCTYCIINLSGQKVSEGVLDSDQQIPLSGISSGYYFLKVNAESQMLVTGFIKR